MTFRSTGGALRAAALALAGTLAAPAAVHAAETPRNELYLAAARGQLEEVERLLAAGADPDGEDGGPHPLAGAIPRHPKVALRLLAAGADSSVGNHNGFLLAGARSVFDRAVRLELYRALLRAGASVPWFSDRELLEELAAEGDLDLLDATLRASDRGTPDRSTATPICEAISRRDPTLIRRLVAGGVDIEGGCDRLQPLSKAAEQGDPALVELVIELGADVDGPRAGGGAPLIAAVISGEVAVARVLLEAGIDIDALGRHVAGEHGTALMTAVKRGHLEMARFLLDHGADPNVGANGWQSPLPIAVRASDNLELFDLLMDRGATVAGDFELASARCQVDKIRRLLAAGADARRRDRDGNPPLVALAGCGRTVIDLLIAGGAEIEGRGRNRETPLISAASAGQVDAVRHLLELGADVEARDVEGKTALMFAVGRDAKLEVVEALVGAGADVHAVDGAGRNALSIAALGRARRTIEWLAARGVTEVTDQHGWTPAHYFWRASDGALAVHSLGQPDLVVAAPADLQRRTPTGDQKELLVLGNPLWRGSMAITRTGVAQDLEDIAPADLTFDPDASTFRSSIGGRRLPCYSADLRDSSGNPSGSVEVGCAVPVEDDVLLVVGTDRAADRLFLRWLVELVAGSVGPPDGRDAAGGVRPGIGSGVAASSEGSAAKGERPRHEGGGRRSTPLREALATTYAEAGPEVGGLLLLLVLAWLLVARWRKGS